MSAASIFVQTYSMKIAFCLSFSFLFVTPVFSEKIIDTVPFEIDTAICTGTNQVDIYFTSSLDQTSAENPAHYTVIENNVHPTYITADVSNQTLIHLIFPFSFSDRVNYDIIVFGVLDISMHVIIDTTVRFVRYFPMPYDIIIDEIMADPSPSNGLPEVEWLEIRNVSPFDINLLGWKLAKPTVKSGPVRSFILKPDSALVLCSTGSVNELSSFCSSISVTSFPSLSNAGDMLSLLAPDGRTIHAVEYTDQWYHNELKKQGGWSLEMIDLNNPCTGIDNWSSSQNIFGATPGFVNSIDAMNIDVSPPQLLRAIATDSVHVVLYFNEPMDSIEATNVNHYHIDNNINVPVSASPIAPLFDKVMLVLSTPVRQNIIGNIIVDGLKDCLFNSIGLKNTVRYGLDCLPDSFDVVVNEILFNPKNDGVDFLELYNRSDKIINIKNLHIANLNTSGSIDNIVSLPAEGYLFFPNQHLVFTTNSFIVKRDFFSNHPDDIIQIDNLPSFNDDEGNVIILNQQGKVMDWLSYEDDWHFKLIDDPEGVSLERIDYNGKTQLATNWHSASTTSGGGTPADKNSQCIDLQSLQGSINIDPKVISPDNDGRDDVANICYSFDGPGYVAAITVFDISGRAVKHLLSNMLCDTKGCFKWDGLDDRNRKLISGNYIVLTEVLNLNGTLKKFKNVIAVRN